MRAAHAGNDAEAAGVVAALGDLEIGEMLRSKTKPGRLPARDVVRPEIHFHQRARGNVGGEGDDLPRLAELVGASKRFFVVVLVAGFGFQLAEPGLHGGLPFPGSWRVEDLLGAAGDGLLDDLADLRDLVDAHEGVDLGDEPGQIIAEALRKTARDDEGLASVAGFADFVGIEDSVDALLLRGVDERTGVDDDRVRLGGVVGDLDAALEERAEHDLGVDKVLGAAEGDQADPEGPCGGQGLR